MAAPYDIVIFPLNSARARLNDKIETLVAIGGQLLENTQPFTQQVVNTAWRRLQDKLRDLGFTRLKREVGSYLSVPAAGSVDSSAFSSISYIGFNDGLNFSSFPLLPSDLIAPLDLWERPSAGGANTAPFIEMDRVLNGLPAVPKASWNRQWEWREDAIYLPGALVATDIRLRYSAYLLDFVDVGNNAQLNQLPNTPWFGQPVPIMQSSDALSSYICAEICKAVKDMDGVVAFTSEADAKAQLILNRDTMQPKAILKASEFGKMRDKYTPRSGVDTEPVDR